MKKSSAKEPDRKGEEIGIVASRYNEKYVDALVLAAQEILKDVPRRVVRVPGAHEIPWAVQRMLRDPQVAVVIAFGVVWQGGTEHARLVAEEVSRALMDLALIYDKPVIHQVLTVSSDKQARARCFGKKLNRGVEGARAALEMRALALNLDKKIKE
ncbi:MAG: 6,7-dimethyl-8-ribityllumazine synthase [Candidatus Methylacidiphilales bacterium]